LPIQLSLIFDAKLKIRLTFDSAVQNWQIYKAKKNAYNDIEFGVDVDQLLLVVDNRQRRDSRAHENVQRLEDGRVLADRPDLVVRADAELANCLLQKKRLRHVVDLQQKKNS
jgi:hypothetical protein